MSMIRKLSLGVALLATLSTVVLTATPAFAGRRYGGPEWCSGGNNGYVDIPDDLNGTVRDTAIEYGGKKVTLETATIRGRTRGFAHLTGGQLQPDDSVWLDVSWDGGNNWDQCGPFLAGGKNSKTSAAMYTLPDRNWVFRACGAINRALLACTDPWW